MTTHAHAKRIVDALPGITPATSLLVRAVAYADSHYDNDNEGHNWGNVTAGPKWEGDTYEHTDSRWDDKLRRVVSYTARFRRHATSEDGAADLWRVLRTNHAGAVGAASRGEWWDVPRELRHSRYYLGTKPEAAAIRDYTKLFRGVLANITSATREPNPMQSATGSVVAWAVTGLLGAILSRGLGKLVRR